ncbi:NAD(P)-binding domain-containing protein [Streptomyces sp. AM 3-1-1]|uniref:NAD(P)-binding domain-containing protein n=1 Tax=Streptomyces sp. AM 3-1-1 TaxID=3028711 RepID=UPI0023BA27EE|nr:NAD(P)-binding domain-containing protein [Streptomyces sp. AM 3-1-1]WEH27599.1 NAD(P)-binding domain-containing protein [Streptomyces sp. AM 3-1-1]
MSVNSDREPRAGVVGLGVIGGGVAVSMAARGRVPVVHDIRAHAADDLPGVPAPLSSPAEVARRADVVMVAVVDAEQARAVLTGPDGLLTAAHPGLVVVLQATVALPVVQELAAACAEAGAGFLDCGVTPGDRAAEHGMVAIVGGDAATVERARPVLDDWARRIVHCGPVGAGMATKIARNVITYGSWRTVHEAAALAGAAGVDPARLAEVIEAADPQGRTLLQLLHMRDGADALPGETGRVIAPLMAKDLAAATALAAERGVRVPLVEVARDRVRETLDLPAEAEAEAGTGTSAGPVAPVGVPRAPAPAAEASPASAPAAQDPRAFGLAVMDRVYGRGFGERMPPPGDLFQDETLSYLFAQVWARPGLAVRDRRLLTLGVAATVGRPDLVEIIVGGALENGELTPAQLEEAALHLATYTGWCKATATHEGIGRAIAAHRARTPAQDPAPAPPVHDAAPTPPTQEEATA